MKEVGTLAEIGAQVGDVVKADHWHVTDRHVVTTESLKNFTADDIRIISRAKPKGPVITETTVTKRIALGRFGEVIIAGHCKADNRVRIIVNGWLSGEDLIAARDVLNQLIEAMPDA